MIAKGRVEWERKQTWSKGERNCDYSNSFCCRKYTLILNNVIIFLGVGLESLAVHPAMFIMGRFIVGVGAGKREGQREGGRK